MKTNFFATAAAFSAIVLLASCAKEPTENGPVAVRFGTNIALPEQLDSRASDGTWTANDPVGIFMLTATGTLPANITEGADNRFYKAAAGSGAVALSPNAADQTIYYPMSATQNVDFVAYYPRVASLAAYTYNIDVSSAKQSDPTKIDLLWAKATSATATTPYNKANATTDVALKFAHKLTKLVMNIDATASATAGVTSLTGMTVSIKGLNVTAPFTLADGIVGTATGVATPITPLEVAAAATYAAILLPTTINTLGDVTVDFTIGTETFTWKVPTDIQLQGGKKNIYTITLSRTAVTATGQITNWTDGIIDGTGTAE